MPCSPHPRRRWVRSVTGFFPSLISAQASWTPVLHPVSSIPDLFFYFFPPQLLNKIPSHPARLLEPLPTLSTPVLHKLQGSWQVFPKFWTQTQAPLPSWLSSQHVSRTVDASTSSPGWDDPAFQAFSKCVLVVYSARASTYSSSVSVDGAPASAQSGTGCDSELRIAQQVSSLYTQSSSQHVRMRAVVSAHLLILGLR